MKDCYDHCSGAGLKVEPIDYTSEHQKVKSRLTGHDVEIEFSPMGGGFVPANPFASKSQAAFAHANPDKFRGEEKLKEWDRATDFKHLPKKVKK
jgi:hypothetical protein